MNIYVRNTLAVIVGLVAGSVVNMLLVFLGTAVIPAPAGVDMTNLDSMKASAHLLEPKHFIFPFLAHALGALIGAWLASVVGASRRLMLALIVGGFFMVGGVVAASMIPAPFWYKAVDILLAYIPMAWLGWKLSGKEKAQ